MPIALDGSVALPEPTRQIILRAALNATSTATPVIDSYRLMVYSVSPLDFGPRFTGKEMDHGTGLVYFGARYYDPEVGRFTTVDPMKVGNNWYEYCYSNPLRFIDQNGLWGSDIHQEWTYQAAIAAGFSKQDATLIAYGALHCDDVGIGTSAYGLFSASLLPAEPVFGIMSSSNKCTEGGQDHEKPGIR